MTHAGGGGDLVENPFDVAGQAGQQDGHVLQLGPGARASGPSATSALMAARWREMHRQILPGVRQGSATTARGIALEPGNAWKACVPGFASGDRLTRTAICARLFRQVELLTGVPVAMAKSEQKPAILVVDDERRVCTTLATFVRAIPDYEALTALTGEEALKLARKHRPVLILLDLVMSDMDGFEVLKQLKDNARTRHIPVVVLTGRTDKEALKQSMYHYAEQFLTKPIDFDQLKSVIQRILGPGSNS